MILFRGFYSISNFARNGNFTAHHFLHRGQGSLCFYAGEKENISENIFVFQHKIAFKYCTILGGAKSESYIGFYFTSKFVCTHWKELNFKNPLLYYHLQYCMYKLCDLTCAKFLHFSIFFGPP